MAELNCRKCGGALVQSDNSYVCSQCGEVYTLMMKNQLPRNRSAAMEEEINNLHYGVKRLEDKSYGRWTVLITILSVVAAVVIILVLALSIKSGIFSRDSQIQTDESEKTYEETDESYDADDVDEADKEEEVPLVAAYRVRKSADDAESQIGAFADLQRAKDFADKHAYEGYEVYDMDGNLIYRP